MSGIVSGLLTGQNSGQLGSLPQGSAQMPPTPQASQGGIPYYLGAPQQPGFGQGLSQGLQGAMTSSPGMNMNTTGNLVGGLIGGSPSGQRLGTILRIVGLL